MENLEKILAQHPFVSGLAPEHVQLMVGCAKNVVFEPGKYLFKENEDANSFYIIRSGKVALEIYSSETGSIIIQTLGEGDIIGWSWMVPPYQWRFDARAMELTRVIELDATCLRSKCETDPAFGYEIMKRLANIFEQRINAMRIQLLDLYGNK